MTHAEKQAVLSRIRESVLAMNGNAAPIKSPWSIYSFGSYITRNIQMHKLASVVAAILIVAISGNSIVLAANEALPGDALYSFKVNVAEPVRVALTADPVKKAEIQTSFVQNRFEEAETLAARGQLDDVKEQEISNLIDRHVASVTQNIEKIDAVSPEKAENSNIAVEASMNAHAKILASLNRHKISSQSQNASRIADKAREDAKKFDVVLARAPKVAPASEPVQVMALRSAPVISNDARSKVSVNEPIEDHGGQGEDSAPVSAMMSVSVPAASTVMPVAVSVSSSLSSEVATSSSTTTPNPVSTSTPDRNSQNRPKSAKVAPVNSRTNRSAPTEVKSNASDVASSTRAAIEVKKQQIEAEIFQKANQRLEKEWKNEELKSVNETSKSSTTSDSRKINSWRSGSDKKNFDRGN